MGEKPATMYVHHLLTAKTQIPSKSMAGTIGQARVWQLPPEPPHMPSCTARRYVREFRIPEIALLSKQQGFTRRLHYSPSCPYHCLSSETV